MKVFNHEIDAFLDEALHLEEIRGYQNRNDILYVEFRARAIVRNNRLTFFVGVLLFQILHEPLKYLDVTVDTNVNVVHTGGLCQIFLEVFHVSDQELLLTGKILVDLAVLVKHMDHYHLLLLTAATGLLETVMYPARSAYTRTARVVTNVIGSGWASGAHSAACLLLL